jgi:hypothetical protein
MQRQRVIAEPKRCIDQEVKRWEEKRQVLVSEVDLMEECQRKSIVVVFGLEEIINEGYMDTVEIIQNFLKKVTKPDVVDKVYFATRAAEDGGRRRPVLDLSPVVQSYNCLETVERVCNISIDEL